MEQLSSRAKDQIQTNSYGANAQLEPIDVRRFRRTRIAKNLTQTDVSATCACSPSFISKWEKGQRKPSETLHRQLGDFQRWMDEKSDPVKARQKHCWNCDRTLDILTFGKDRSRKSGLQSKCKECNAVYSAGWRVANQERLTLAREQKSVSKRARQPARLRGERDSPRDFKEFIELGEEKTLKLRKKLPRGFSNERKTAKEKATDEFLAKYPEGSVIA